MLKNKRKQTCKECGIRLQAGGQDGKCDCCHERGSHSALGHQPIKQTRKTK